MTKKSSDPSMERANASSSIPQATSPHDFFRAFFGNHVGRLEPSSIAADIRSTVDPATLSDHRKTQLGLHLTSRDAHVAVSRAPSILFVDVRTPEEFGLVGHPKAIDRNIPFAWLGQALNPVAGQYGFVINEQFVNEMNDFVSAMGGARDTNIILICRSGSRSAAAANLLAQSGYTNVWSVVDGFEGSTDKRGTAPWAGGATKSFPGPTGSIRPRHTRETKPTRRRTGSRWRQELAAFLGFTSGKPARSSDWIPRDCATICLPTNSS